MRILLLGSTGVLGRAVQAALSERHEILGASRHGPALSADLGDPASLASLLDRASQHDSSPLDAVVCTAGESRFGPLAAMTDESLVAGLRPKLLGQITLACLAFARLNECGSVTLTSGVLNQRPIRGCTGAAIVNGGLEGFVRAAALEAPRGVRINVVSPSVVVESWPRYGSHFAGFSPVAASAVAQAYVRAVEGDETGCVLPVH